MSAEFEKRLEELIALLHDRHLRVTRPRKAILRVLLHADQPVSVEGVYRRVRGVSLDPATVYRSLEALRDLQVVVKSHSEEGTAVYRLCPRNVPASVLVCRTCHAESPLPTSQIMALQEAAREMGFGEVTPPAQIQGVCAECAEAP